MRYDDSDRESSNVEDRRGESRPGGFRFPSGGGGGMRIPSPLGRGGGLSLTSLLIIGGIMLLLGINPLDVLRDGSIEIPQFPQIEQQRRAGREDIPGLPGRSGPATKGQDEMRTFVSRVLADTEDTWREIFTRMGRTYEEPRLVLFDRETQTRCGEGLSAMGPFYCPLDKRVYIDLAFYEELRTRFRAPGDFAQAYVIAHEVGHHVQTLLGISAKVMAEKQRNPAGANQIQVRMELQADCLAGVWAGINDQMKKRLQPGDIDEALRAAAAIGDDTLQRQATGRVVPESFTHGSAAQRQTWFKRGFEQGQISACNTFSAGAL